MNDESQQAGEHVRKKDPPAPEAVGEVEDSAEELLFPLEIVRIDNTEPSVLWGSGSSLILRAADPTGRMRMYYLKQEQLEAACAEIADAEGIQEEEGIVETDAEEYPLLQARMDEVEAAKKLNAAARICVQLDRIAGALGADTIPFTSDSDLDDVGRVEFRLMDIAGALERLNLADPA